MDIDQDDGSLVALASLQEVTFSEDIGEHYDRRNISVDCTHADAGFADASGDHDDRAAQVEDSPSNADRSNGHEDDQGEEHREHDHDALRSGSGDEDEKQEPLRKHDDDRQACE